MIITRETALAFALGDMVEDAAIAYLCPLHADAAD